MISVFLLACTDDSRANPRAYIEGKIASSTINYKEYKIRIVSGNRVVAETLLEAGGLFKLSGPLGEGAYKLTSDEKIKSFSADKSTLKIASDSLSIEIPPQDTFIRFNEITLKK